MKLIRFGAPGQEKPGVELSNGRRVDASSAFFDYDEAFFASDGLTNLSRWVADKSDNAPTVSNDVRLGPPIARPSKIVCIGLNYKDHAAEAGLEVPGEPVIFFKSTSAITGPYDPLIIPRNSVKTDWEVELAVVIGKRASYIEKVEAEEHIAGYMLHNDYSERAFQIEHKGQWVKGKSCDTFAPLGPYLVTSDEIDNVHLLSMWLTVNEEMKQDSNTGNMIFDIPTVVSYLSQFMTLLPGDVISTGTPAGVGLGFDPPQYLKAGDVVELGIEKLGKQKQIAASYS